MEMALSIAIWIWHFTVDMQFNCVMWEEDTEVKIMNTTMIIHV